MRPSLVGALVVGVSLVGACSDDDAAAPASGTAPTTTGTTVTTSTGPATTTTDAPVPTSSTTTTTTTPERPGAGTCDPTAVRAEADRVIAVARLAPGDAWAEGTDGGVFGVRTHDSAEFAYRTGLDCHERAVQTTSAGAERLLVTAWTGERWAMVVQATDGPETPYRPDQRVQLLVATPTGEWLDDQRAWAGTLDDGETVIVAVDDLPFAVAAKAWPAAVPRFEDLPVTIESEQHGVDVLLAAGARNVSVAEPAGIGVIGAIQHITPLGLHLIATVAPSDAFDPTAPIVVGEVTVELVDGVTVHVTRAEEGSYAVASTGWVCGDHAWFIDSAWGTVDELVDWTGRVIGADECT